MVNQNIKKKLLKNRFDGFLPVIIDVETAGVNSKTDALLEIAAVLVDYNEQGLLAPKQSFACHVEPFASAHLDPRALEINRIDPYHPFRFAIKEKDAITQLFQFVSIALKEMLCRRAVLVGHNAHFDLSFIQAAAKRCEMKSSPFHAFTCFDTATLSGLIYGKTVLAKALALAKIDFNKNEAHSAIYDADRTAELFCQIINHFSPQIFKNDCNQTDYDEFDQ